ncbi:pirin family protein [Archangium sp.]|uniref:pirin family protein n=1 Tax=Archangium sp. TaxID=1872627 RepID=UPI002D4C3724|nr:pirin family protein [Archangium sp.]HYO54341.1 pirin family protein [Archangium sp.]
MERHVRSVNPVLRLPANSQTVAKNLILEPGQWEEFDPFLLMLEDWVAPHGGFPNHPHRGFETVTLMLEGQLEHRDSRGNQGVLGPGDVQWMTAASGIIHSEMPHGGGTSHLLQLWLNLSPEDKRGRPGYQDLRADSIPTRTENGVVTRVISGEQAGLRASTRNHVPVLMLEIRAEAGASTRLDVPARYNGFVYVLSGKGRFGAKQTKAEKGQVLWLSRDDEASTFTVHVDEPLHLFFAAGVPIGAPVVAHGPFVMNTREEIVQAFDDYRRGRLDRVL